jgi:hypothetical protein
VTTETLPNGKRLLSSLTPNKMSKNNTTTSNDTAKTASFIGKAIADFVRLSDKLATQKETLTALVKNYAEQGGDMKKLRKEIIAAGVDRRRVSEVLLSLGVKDENHEARSNAAKKKAPSKKNVEASAAVVDFVKGQAKAKKDQEEILELALKALRSK